MGKGPSQIVGVWQLVSDANAKDGVAKPGSALGPKRVK